MLLLLLRGVQSLCNIWRLSNRFLSQTHPAAVGAKRSPNFALEAITQAWNQRAIVAEHDVRSHLSRFASVALLRGILSRPRRKNGKTINFSIFTIFTTDMVEKKGAPPGKNGKKKNDFYRFYRGYGREKRGAPGKNGKKRTFSIFTVFTANMVEKKGAHPR